MKAVGSLDLNKHNIFYPSLHFFIKLNLKFITLFHIESYLTELSKYIDMQLYTVTFDTFLFVSR